MRRLTLFGLSLVAAAAGGSPAQAQTMNTQQWSGFYVGVNAGGLFGNTSTSDIGPAGPGGLSGSGGGFIGGVQGGYNTMFGPVMLGAEIDFQGSTYAAGLSGGGPGGPANATEYTPWFSTFRARGGYAFGSILPYLTGGAVWGQRTLTGGGPGMPAFSASSTYWTWTVGGGVEAKLAERWSAKVEYLYMGTPSTSLSPAGVGVSSETSSGNLFRVGLNFHF